MKLYAYCNRIFTSETIEFKEIWNMFIPILLDQAMLSMINIANAAMISSSGQEAMAAVSMVDTLNLFFTNFFIAIATGCTVVVAQYSGRRQKLKIGKAIAQSVGTSVVIASIIGTFLVLFCKPTLHLLLGDVVEKIFDYATIYLIYSALTYPLFAVIQVILGTMRGLGDGKASMHLSLFVNGLYILGNILFLNVFHLSICRLIS